MKPWLIAHRGSQCDGRENTLAAFQPLKNYPLGLVEFDLHATSDGKVVAHHDFDIAGHKIAEHSLDQLRIIDPELLTFDQVLKAIGPDLQLIIEIKAKGTGRIILDQLKNHRGWLVASYKYEELVDLAKLGIDKNRLLLLQHYHPFGQIKKALNAKFGGIGVKKFYLLPWVYRRAQKNRIYIYGYTINSRLAAKALRRFYPNLGICTNRLDRLQDLE